MKMVFEAGAHNGDEIVRWEREGYDKIVAIEPQKLFCERIAKLYPNAIVVNAALWSSAGEQHMYSCGLTTLSTIVQKKTTSGRFKKHTWSKESMVPTITLDTLIDRYGIPRRIKMDIEGAEKDALQGLSHPVDIVSFEYTAEFVGDAIDCIKMLQLLGEYSFIIRRGESTISEFNITSKEAIAKLENLRARSGVWGMIDAIRVERTHK